MVCYDDDGYLIHEALEPGDSVPWDSQVAVYVPHFDADGTSGFVRIAMNYGSPPPAPGFRAALNRFWRRVKWRVADIRYRAGMAIAGEVE